jgi:hypothetical protein
MTATKKEPDMTGQPTVFCQTVTNSDKPKEKPDQDIRSLNIYERMSAIVSELSYVAKNLTVGVNSKSAYKAVGEADILSSVIPLERKFRVYSYPYSREIVEEKDLTNQNGYIQHYCKIASVYRFQNIDKPEEYVEVTSYGEGLDAGDKGMGKAMTYCDKYALMKAYKIRTGEDPDQDASVEMKGEVTSKAATPQQLAIIMQCEPDRITNMLSYFHKDKIGDLSMEEASNAIKILKKEK